MKISLRVTRWSGVFLLALFLVSVSACSGGGSSGGGNPATPTETVVTGRA
jgi:hypothetical protein